MRNRFPSKAMRLKELRWLVDFTQKPEIRQLLGKRVVASAEELANIYSHMAMFAMGLGSEVMPEELDDLSDDARAAVQQAMHEVSQGIERLVSDDHRWVTEVKNITLRMDLSYERTGKPERYTRPRGPVAAQFIWQAMELASIAPIRRCPVEACGRMFVPTKRQEYCGPRCSQKMRNQRFRQGNANPALARHLAKRASKGKDETTRVKELK
jgi:hypothetical protein